MGKALIAAGLVSFVVALTAEIAFILLGLTAVSASGSSFPTWVSGLVVWVFIGLGVLCWVTAAAFALIRLFRNR